MYGIPCSTASPTSAVLQLTILTRICTVSLTILTSLFVAVLICTASSLRFSFNHSRWRRRSPTSLLILLTRMLQDVGRAAAAQPLLYTLYFIQGVGRVAAAQHLLDPLHFIQGVGRAAAAQHLLAGLALSLPTTPTTGSSKSEYTYIYSKSSVSNMHSVHLSTKPTTISTTYNGIYYGSYTGTHGLVEKGTAQIKY